MADIGVLNLQIKDNSQEAAGGLESLADALGRVKRACDPGKISDYSDALKKLTRAIETGANSYKTLGRLATAMERVKEAATGFKLPNFTRLESLAQSLQENYNAETGLKRIAEGMDAVKSASQGFQMPNMKGLEKVIGSISGNAATESESTAKAMETVREKTAEVSTQMNELRQDISQTFDQPVQDQQLPLGISETERQIQELMDYLRQDVDYSNLRNIADYYAGIGRSANVTKEEVQVFSTEASQAIDRLMDRLNNPVKMKNGALADFINQSMGIGKNFASLENDADLLIKQAGALNDAYERSLEPVRQMATTFKAAEESSEQIYQYSLQVSRELNEKYNRQPDTLESVFNSRGALGFGLRNDSTDSKTFMYSVDQMAKRFSMTVDEVRQRIMELRNAAAQVAPTIGSVAEAMTGGSAARVETMINETDQIDLMIMKEQGMKQALIEDVEAGKLSQQQMADRVMQFQTFQDKLDNLILGEQEAETTTRSFTESLKDLWSTVKKSTLGKLGSQFARLVKYRMLRAIIKQISEGLKEGIENVYEYSKAIGSSFAPEMDSAASSLLQMKNSIGAAVAPLLQSLIPILQSVVNWFIEAVNYVNQFLALLRGQQTWTRAVPATTKAFDNQKKAAKGAAAAVKDLLADWDELNIIQSQTSGAGSGTGKGTAEDYLNMFEEEAVFDNKVRDLVDFIKNNFDSIRQIAEAVGVAILAWKFSSLFTGNLADLMGLLGTAAIVDLVFRVSSEFTSQYFKTGDAGWLVGNFLTTLVGGVFAKKILTSVLGGNGGAIMIPIVFWANAFGTVKALMTDPDISAWSPEAIGASIEGALSSGAAAGYLAHLADASIGTSLAAGAAAAVITFGAIVGLKADAQVTAEGITPDTIKAKAASAISMALGGAALGAAAGGGLAGAIGFGMLMGAIPIATFGIAIGLNAVNKVVDGSAITSDIVKQNFISGGIVGAGLAIGQIPIAGFGIGIIGTGATAAAFTIGALFIIEAIIAKQPKKIQWGDYVASKEAIENYVNGVLYEKPPEITISLIQATIAPLGEAKKNLEEQAKTVIGTLNAAEVGVATTVDDLKKQIDALVKDFNSASEQYQNTLQVALTLVPVQGEDGKNESDEIIKNSKNRWTALNNIMTQLGTDLANAYKIAYDKELDANLRATAQETVKEISEMMYQVSMAISSGQARAEASHAIKMQMMNLSEGTFSGIMDEYKKQQDALIEELKKVRAEAAEGVLAQQYAFEELANYRLQQVGGDTTDALYQQYITQMHQAEADYKRIIATIEQDAKDRAAKLIDPEEMQRLRDAALQYMARSASVERYLDAFSGMYSDSFAAQIELWSGEGNIFKGEKVRQNIQDLLMNFILASFQGDQDKKDVQKAINLNILKWSDFINAETINALADALQIQGADREVFNQIVSEFLGYNIGTVEPEVKVQPEIIEEDPEAGFNPWDEAADKITKSAKELEPEVTVAPQLVADDTTNPDNPKLGIAGEVEDVIEEAQKVADMHPITINVKPFNLRDFFLGGIELSGEGREYIQSVLDVIASGGGSAGAYSAMSNASMLYDPETLQEAAGIIANLMNDLTEMEEKGFVNPATLERKYAAYGTGSGTAGAGETGDGQLLTEIVKFLAGLVQSNNDNSNTTNSLLRLLVNKDTTVTVSPSSMWGMFNNKSAEQYAKAWGEEP